MTVLNQIYYYQTIFYFNFQYNKNVFYFNSIITTLKMDNRNNNNLILHERTSYVHFFNSVTLYPYYC